MSRFLFNLRKSLVCFIALATTASMFASVSAYAAETTSEVSVDNYTQGRENARTVSGITISDVDVPEEGKRLDDEAVVTTAEGETWAIPVIWISEDLEPAAGLAGKGSYLPVLAYFVPDEYTVRSNDATGRGYRITLTGELLKLFGEAKIISIYENNTGITYIIPAKLKDLFAQKGIVRNPTDAGGNEIVPPDQVAPYPDEVLDEPEEEQITVPEEEKEEEQEETPEEEKEEEQEEAPEEEKEEEQEETPEEEKEEKSEETPEEEKEEEQEEVPEEEKEEKPEETPEKEEEQEEVPEEEKGEEQEEVPEEDIDENTYSHIVNVHCNDNAKNALTDADLEFLADLVVNTLQPQAVNLLIEKFPAFKEAAEEKKIGEYITVIVSYEEGKDATGYASHGWTTDDEYPEYQFVYSLTVNASSLTDHKEGDKAIITRDVSSAALTDLANTIVHELFHCVEFDYNRPGLTGYLFTDGELVDYTENGTDKVLFPLWFIEGSASTVENNWQFRQEALRVLRTPINDSPLDNYQKDLLVKRYVDGRYHLDDNQIVCDYNFDIEYCNGRDRNGIECDNTASRYVGGYLACMYLYELAARSDPAIGTSRSASGEITLFSSEKLRLGMNSILKRMHNGETLDQVISSISGGAYKDTADFEARFIKGPKDETDGKYSLEGDEGSVSFVCDFMNYMNEIDKAKERGERSCYANGSVLFDFVEDFSAPLSFEGTNSTSVLQPLDNEEGNFQRYARSTVPESSASSTGGKSQSGNPVGASGGSSSNILTFPVPAQENDPVQEAAKESAEVADGDVSEYVPGTAAEIVPEADAGPIPEAAAEIVSEADAGPIQGTDIELVPEADAEPAPEVQSGPEDPADNAAEKAVSEEADAETVPEAETGPGDFAGYTDEGISEEEAEPAPEAQAGTEDSADIAAEEAVSGDEPESGFDGEIVQAAARSE